MVNKKRRLVSDHFHLILNSPPRKKTRSRRKYSIKNETGPPAAAAAAPSRKPAKCHFLDLPAELRIEIYRHLLWTRRAWSISRVLGFPYYDLWMPTLRINRQIHDEACAVFRQNRFVVFRIPWPNFHRFFVRHRLLPLVVETERAGLFRTAHMMVSLEDPDEGQGGLRTYVMSAEDLAWFCKMLVYFDYETDCFGLDPDFEIEMGDPYGKEGKVLPRAEQESLLEPLAFLKGLMTPRVIGNGAITPEQQLAYALLDSPPTRNRSLKEAMGLKVQGRAAFCAENYKLSVEKFQAALEAMDILLVGTRPVVFLKKQYKAGMMASLRADLFRSQLSVILYWDLVTAHLALRNWRTAYAFGSYAMRKASHQEKFQRDRIHGQEIFDLRNYDEVSQHLSMAKACNGLGKKKATEEKKHLLDAIRLDPRNKEVHRGLERFWGFTLPPIEGLMTPVRRLPSFRSLFGA